MHSNQLCAQFSVGPEPLSGSWWWAGRFSSLALMSGFKVAFNKIPIDNGGQEGLGLPNMTAFIDGEVNSDAGRITTTAGPARRIQLGARLVF